MDYPIDPEPWVPGVEWLPKPCPFCGLSQMLGVKNAPHPFKYVECLNCGAHGPRTRRPKKDWDKRVIVDNKRIEFFAEDLYFKYRVDERTWINLPSNEKLAWLKKAEKILYEVKYEDK